MMNPAGRKSNGVDDWLYTADGKKFFIVGESLKADKLPAPNHAQLQTAILPIDERWKPSWFRRFALHPVSVVLFALMIGALIYVVVNL